MLLRELRLPQAVRQGARPQVFASSDLQQRQQGGIEVGELPVKLLEEETGVVQRVGLKKGDPGVPRGDPLVLQE